MNKIPVHNDQKAQLQKNGEFNNIQNEGTSTYKK